MCVLAGAAVGTATRAPATTAMAITPATFLITSTRSPPKSEVAFDDRNLDGPREAPARTDHDLWLELIGFELHRPAGDEERQAMTFGNERGERTTRLAHPGR